MKKMTRRIGNMLSAALISGILFSLGTSQAAEGNLLPESVNRPNIVIIVSDDQGFADAGFRGSDIRTPNLDRLAANGIVLDRFYTQPMCSPTRVGLLTGRWPIRSGMMRGVVAPWHDRGLPLDEPILPEMLAESGYQHRACIGKWHLGLARRKWLPHNRGFTHFFGCYTGAIDYFSHQRMGERDLHRNGKPVVMEGYLTDLIAAEAETFIATVPEAESFFLYVPFLAPHDPFQAKQEDIDRYAHRQGQKRIYAAMVDSMDQAIGRILAAIERRDDSENTLILFFSDNGGIAGIADNDPLEGRKLTVLEGGTRTLAIIYWPDGGLKGGSVFDGHIGYIDIVPTVRRVAGLPAATDPPLDGIDILDAIRDGTAIPERPWFTYLHQNAGQQASAVHKGPWKLRVQGAVPDENSTRRAATHLHHIIDDPRETTDLSGQHPEIVEELLGLLRTFRALEPPDPIPLYPRGREGFVPPENWNPLE